MRQKLICISWKSFRGNFNWSRCILHYCVWHCMNITKWSALDTLCSKDACIFNIRCMIRCHSYLILMLIKLARVRKCSAIETHQIFLETLLIFRHLSRDLISEHTFKCCRAQSSPRLQHVIVFVIFVNVTQTIKFCLKVCWKGTERHCSWCPNFTAGNEINLRNYPTNIPASQKVNARWQNGSHVQKAKKNEISIWYIVLLNSDVTLTTRAKVNVAHF